MKKPAPLDLTVYGRQEMWEDSPAGWPQRLKASKISVPMDVPSPSGLDSKLDTLTTWAIVLLVR